MTTRILAGDCLAVLPTLEANSVDAIVTDPPYELGFMGKRWDSTGVAFRPETWAAALRVAKPGAHLVAFGGTRTYHRLACAIEDAGWEIRDGIGFAYTLADEIRARWDEMTDSERQGAALFLSSLPSGPLAWVYGSGFPKSLDASKAIDGLDAPDATFADALTFTKWLRASGITRQQIRDATGSFMDSHYLTAGSQPAIPTTEHWAAMRPLLRCEIPAWVDRLIGKPGTASENLAPREILGTKTGKDARGGDMYRPGTGNYIANKFAVSAPYTDAARHWDGWGTALKPAWEPIILARKPLAGTVPRNILAHGTGALNIDGCRIAVTGDDYAKNCSGDRGHEDNRSRDLAFGMGCGKASDAGRWPANVVLNEDSARLLDVQAPASGAAAPASGPTLRGRADEGMAYGARNGLKGEPAFHNDVGGASRFFFVSKDITCERNAPDASGAESLSASCATASAPSPAPTNPERAPSPHGPASTAACESFTPTPSPALADRREDIGTTPTTPTCCASCGSALPATAEYTRAESEERAEGVNAQVGGTRFWYSAKASRSERNAGLHGLALAKRDASRAEGAPGGDNPRNRGARPVANSHPTVKPLDLMRWLVRLVTPPRGTILDPFAGSGSTGCAAEMEGFDSVLIEREPEYVEIIRARVAHHASRYQPCLDLNGTAPLDTPDDDARGAA